MTALVFALTPLMSSEEALKEVHAQVAASTLVNKPTLQAIIVVVMSYERICSTARAVAAAAGAAYVPHTLPQYQALIDRVQHAAYIAAAPPPAHADLFDEHLADAADDLQGAFDAFIADKRFNNIYTAGGAGAINAANIAQQARIDRGLQSLMKDCNYQLATALCAAFSTTAMAAYHHLVNLDFVRAATSGETNFGRIPNADVPYPHLQLFGRLTDEYFKAGRLLGSSSDNHFAIFNASDLGAGLEDHKKSTEAWFISVKSMNFPITNDQLDWLHASSLLHFIYKCSQSPEVPRPLRQLYINFFQKVCVEQNSNPNPITSRRLAVMEETFRTDCAAGRISTTFEAKTPSFQARALHGTDDQTDIEQLVAKALEKLNVRPAAGDRRARGARGNTPFELSCFWCGGKGHTLFECPDPPPNAKAKTARDMVAAAKENKATRNARTEARRLAPAATSAFITDDEDEFSE